MKKEIERFASKTVKKVSDKFLYYDNKKDALNYLKKVELIKGKTSPKLIQLSDEYARDILGWHGYAPWLYVYSAIRGEFKEGWIPVNYYNNEFVPKLKGNYGSITHLKALNSALFGSDCFPDIMYLANHFWLDRSYSVIPRDKLKGMIGKHEKVVFKLDSSFRGKGVFVIESDNVDFESMEKKGNGVLQGFIRQHPFFNEFMPSNVATMRFTTALDNDGNASLRACFIRFGRAKYTHVISASQVRVPIDITSGELSPIGYMTDWSETEVHPDTKTAFKKKVVPHFKECIKAVLDLHKKVSFNRVIGWDVIVDENEQIKIMEWNGFYNGIIFSEATQGPIFKGLGYEDLLKSLK